MNPSTISRLAEFAEDQWGLFTRQQAEARSVSSRTLDRLQASGAIERIVQGVYHLAGAPPPAHMELRAAWLQLAPSIPAWERKPKDGVVSHRSAALLYGLGDIAPNRHEFTLPIRRQSRRRDVHFYMRSLRSNETSRFTGLPVTRPARVIYDLLDTHEEPMAVARAVADVFRNRLEQPTACTDAIAPLSHRLGFRRGDGSAVLRWLLDLAGAQETQRWLEEAASNHDQP